MPFTPFHFGLNALIGLPLRKYIDIPATLVAALVIFPAYGFSLYLKKSRTQRPATSNHLEKSFAFARQRR